MCRCFHTARRRIVGVVGWNRDVALSLVIVDSAEE